MHSSRQLMMAIAVALPLGLLVLGCDAFREKSPTTEDHIFNMDQLPNDCEIRPEELAKFATADVAPQLRCLETKLLQFSRYVDLTNPQQINAQELTKFINKFFPEQKNKILPPMKILFTLNHLLFEDQPEIIALRQIPELTDLLIMVNQELNQINREKSNPRRLGQRQLFIQSISHQMKQLEQLSVGKKQQTTSLNLISFLQDILQSFHLPGDLEQMRQFLFLKRLLLGGEAETITTAQIHLLFAKMPSLASIAFDFLFPTPSSARPTPEIPIANWPLWFQHLRSIQEQIAPDIPATEVLFTTETILAIGKQFAPQLDWELFTPILRTVKEKLFSGKADQYTTEDVQLILGQFIDLTEALAFSQLTFPQIEQPHQLPPPGELIFPDLPAYQQLRSEKLEANWQQFVHFLSHYRYYLTPSQQLYYGPAYQPRLYGLEVAQLVYWAMGKMLQAYGSLRQGTAVCSTKQLENALLAFRPLLEHFHFWPQYFNSFALNTAILVDLFQNQSNGDNFLEQDELTEYVLMIISTVQVQQRVQLELPKYCQPVTREPLAVDTLCHRKNILPILMHKVNWGHLLPQLSQYFYRTNFNELQQLIKSLEDFARDFPDEKNPISPRDRTLIIGALMNIESMFLRFDQNQDNVLDYPELLKAYALLKDILMTYLTEYFELEPGLAQTYSKSIFFFLVDRRYPPGKYELLWFHYMVDITKIKAYRINIGAVLSYFANTNRAQKNKYKNQQQQHLEDKGEK